MEAVADPDPSEDQLELFEGHSVTAYEGAFGNLAQWRLRSASRSTRS